MRAIGSPRTDRKSWVDVGWGLFSLVNLGAIIVFEYWETIPFHFIWISFTIVYGFRVWATRPTLVVLGVVMATTAGAIGLDVHRGTEPLAELTEVPLMASMFLAMVWNAQRRLVVTRVVERVSQDNERLLATQRRFLQDASHHVRTPITIALGHAELLEPELAGRPEAADLRVILEELFRLRRLGDRLLDIAAAEDPDFLRPEPVDMAGFTRDLLSRWSPTVPRRWELGRLDEVTAWADPERLALAAGALLENAIQSTVEDDVIRLSVTGGDTAVLIVSDSGAGMAPAELTRVFERFQTGARGTGLGLTLVRAIAHAHGGEITVRSVQGTGTDFALELPAVPALLSEELPGLWR